MNKDLILLDKYNRLANMLCVKAMYLKNHIKNIENLTFDDIKDKVSGHWGNVSQINFVFSHLNLFCKKYNKSVGFVIGTGHSGLPLLVNLYLEGEIKKAYPDITLGSLLDDFGQEKGFRSEISPEYPGVIYDGGELGYSLPVSIGAVLNSKRIVFCLIGDGEAETGTISSSWVLNKYLQDNDGIVVPILNLNGFKMGSESIFSKMQR